MSQDTRSALLSAPFHDAPAIVGGYPMRPLSLASYDVLLRTGNPLVSGAAPAENTPEFTGALLGFVYAHCAPWPDVVRSSFDAQAFREDALIFCGDMDPADFAHAFRQIEAQGKQLGAAQVTPAAGGREKKHRPAMNPAS